MSKWSHYWGRTVRNSTKSLIEAAESGLCNGGDTPNDTQRAQLVQAIADTLYLLDITPSELAALAPDAPVVK